MPLQLSLQVFSALAMHGRTREQMYTGHCDHETLARVAKAITKIPFIGMVMFAVFKMRNL